MTFNVIRRNGAGTVTFNVMPAALMFALIAGWVAVLLAATPVGQGGHASTSSPGPDFSAVREFITSETSAGSTPSMAVAVARGGEILWEEGFGWIDGRGGTAATADTPYYAASVTKAITATALMILHQRHQLDLDRPANLYLKTAKLRSPQRLPVGTTLGAGSDKLSGFDNRLNARVLLSPALAVRNLCLWCGVGMADPRNQSSAAR